jgi:diguanylate cyclase (GGDEF)-like protein
LPIGRRMRLIDRRDTPLVAALLIGTLVMFAQPLRFALSIAEEVSRTYHVDLVPGLFVFVLVLSVHLRMRHRDAVLGLRLATSETRDAKRHSDRMAQLVSASQAFAAALDLPTLRREVLHHVPALIDERPFCLGHRCGDRWEWLCEPPDQADDSLAETGRTLFDSAIAALDHGRWRLCALVSGDRRVGVLGILVDRSCPAGEDGSVEAISAVLAVNLRNVELFEELKVSSVSDRLTGCFNQAYAFSTLDAELRRAKRSRAPLAVVMLDIDGFKQVNDEHGHLCGDRLLAAVGATLRRTLRTTDVKCRYGGDEFLAILPETPPDAAAHVAEHLRRAIEGIELSGPAGNVGPMKPSTATRCDIADCASSPRLPKDATPRRSDKATDLLSGVVACAPHD